MDWGWLTPIVIPIWAAVYAYEFVSRRVIKGDIHWNESSQDSSKLVGKPCYCRVHKGKVYNRD